MASSTKPPPKPPPEATPTPIIRPPIPNNCVKCTRGFQYKNEAFFCSFCFKPTHITCAHGTYTTEEVEKLKKRDEFFKIACCVCSAKLPKSDPINSLIDEAIPMKTLDQKQSKLTKIIKELEDIKNQSRTRKREHLWLKGKEMRQ